MHIVGTITFFCFVLSACGTSYLGKNVAFEDSYFVANLKSTSSDKTKFIVTVKKAKMNLDGAREAGRYEGVKHCIEHFGTSDIKWISGPDSKQIKMIGDKLLLKGKCAL